MYSTLKTIYVFKSYIPRFLIHVIKRRPSNVRLEWRTWLDQQKDLPFYFSFNLKKLKKTNNGIILISHDASLTGAPLLTLDICDELQKKGYNVLIILSLTGELTSKFIASAPTLVLNLPFGNFQHEGDITNLLKNLHKKGYTKCIANTVISGKFAPSLKASKIQSIYLFHELIDSIHEQNLIPHLKLVSDLNDKVIFSSTFVRNKYDDEFNFKFNNYSIIPQGVKNNLISSNKSYARDYLCKILNILNPQDVKIIVGAGMAGTRKGTDIFIEIADMTISKYKKDNFHFVWLGDQTPSFKVWYKNFTKNKSTNKNIHFLNFMNDPKDVFSGADAFILTSREDPLPSVALIAMLNLTPVLCFKDTGGIPELLSKFESQLVVDLLNKEEMTRKLLQVLSKEDSYKMAIEIKESLSELSMEKYVTKLNEVFLKAKRV